MGVVLDESVLGATRHEIQVAKWNNATDGDEHVRPPDETTVHVEWQDRDGNVITDPASLKLLDAWYAERTAR